MSESLLPWIVDYLVGVAEDYGTNATSTSSVPLAPKKKKVQLIQFLTYPPEGTDELTTWAEVSDKVHWIPVRFTKDAVSTWMKRNGKRFTQLKTAIIQLRKFRFLFSRVPLPQTTHKPHVPPDARLCLECYDFDVIGAVGESTFGRPAPLQTHALLEEWAAGLRAGGGAGNVLKLRKSAAEARKGKTDTGKKRQVPAQQTLDNVERVEPAAKPPSVTKPAKVEKNIEAEWNAMKRRSRDIPEIPADVLALMNAPTTYPLRSRATNQPDSYEETSIPTPSKKRSRSSDFQDESPSKRRATSLNRDIAGQENEGVPNSTAVQHTPSRSSPLRKSHSDSKIPSPTRFTVRSPSSSPTVYYEWSSSPAPNAPTNTTVEEGSVSFRPEEQSLDDPDLPPNFPQSSPPQPGQRHRSSQPFLFSQPADSQRSDSRSLFQSSPMSPQLRSLLMPKPKKSPASAEKAATAMLHPSSGPSASPSLTKPSSIFPQTTRTDALSLLSNNSRRHDALKPPDSSPNRHASGLTGSKSLSHIEKGSQPSQSSSRGHSSQSAPPCTFPEERTSVELSISPIDPRKATALRKVPRPVQRVDVVGPVPVVLAPNSDVSMSQSQSQHSQSQSQPHSDPRFHSQSQGFSQSQSQSQSRRGSHFQPLLISSSHSGESNRAIASESTRVQVGEESDDDEPNSLFDGTDSEVDEAPPEQEVKEESQDTHDASMNAQPAFTQRDENIESQQLVGEESDGSGEDSDGEEEAAGKNDTQDEQAAQEENREVVHVDSDDKSEELEVLELTDASEEAREDQEQGQVHNMDVGGREESKRTDEMDEDDAQIQEQLEKSMRQRTPIKEEPDVVEHDPKAWALPAFMQQPRKPVPKSEVKASSVKKWVSTQREREASPTPSLAPQRKGDAYPIPNFQKYPRENIPWAFTDQQLRSIFAMLDARGV